MVNRSVIYGDEIKKNIKKGIDKLRQWWYNVKAVGKQ